MLNFIKKKKVLIIISLLLFAIPFFWLKPGEMDLGGDSSRLYFYDPMAVLYNSAQYMLVPEGKGSVDIVWISHIPFIVFLAALKFFLQSPYLLISFFNSIKLVIGFLAVYGIVKELLNEDSKSQNTKYLSEASSILAGLFYVFSPSMIPNWDKALITHHQVFLNPLIFYLILRYILSKNWLYIWGILIITFIFALNFSFSAAPPFFAFYPLSITFIIIYLKFIRKISIPWKGLSIGLFIFVCLQIFHLIPLLVSLFDKTSNVNSRVFDRSLVSHQLDYFFGILPTAKVSTNILKVSILKEAAVLSIIVPFIIILGFIFNRKNKTMLLAGLFFLITVYLLSAKITGFGVLLYQKLILIPGFAMFENFIGQWLFVSSFFESILLGLALFIVFQKLKPHFVKLTFLTVSLSLFAIAWPFINGKIVNKTHFQSKDVKIGMTMNPQYEKAITEIKNMPDDGKILSLPFTDCCYQVIHGLNNGAYVGPSTIPFLTGKRDFVGYANTLPFSEDLLPLVKNKDYASIKHLLYLFNINYIFYNSDSKVYNTTFPGYPYSVVRNFFPADQKGYQEFVKNLSSKKLLSYDTYHLYMIDEEYSSSRIYAPIRIIIYPLKDRNNKPNTSFFINDYRKDKNVAYIDQPTCKKIFPDNSCAKEILIKNPPKVSFQNINPTKYTVSVDDRNDPFILVLSNSFHPSWTLGNTKNSHFTINGYANGWLLYSKDKSKPDYQLTLEMTGQKLFTKALAFSSLAFIIIFLWGTLRLLKRK